MLPVLVLLAAAPWLFRTPWSASELGYTPDAIEYALTAHRFAREGRFCIEIEGVCYPSRYPPFFSILFLAPIYRLWPAEIGAGILPVFAFAMLGVLSAFRIGERFAGPWGGLWSAALLVTTPQYRELGREVMSDVPAAALILAGCWLYLAGPGSSGPAQERSPGHIALAGAIGGLASAMRVLAGAILLPFLWSLVRARVRGGGAGPVATIPSAAAGGSPRPDVPRRRTGACGAVASLFMLLGPTIAVHAATAAYNHAVFGDWARTGRHFWRPVPFDYPEMLVSLAYVVPNLAWLADPRTVVALAGGCLGALAIRATGSRPALAAFLCYAALAAGVPAAIHLVYFFYDMRFYLPVHALLAVLAGAGLGAAMPASLRARAGAPAALAAGIVLAAAAWRAGIGIDPVPTSRVLAESAARHTPEGSVVISAIEPPYLEHVLAQHGARRRVVPLSRRVQYALSLVAPARIDAPSPPPRSVLDVRSPGLVRGGARDVVSYTPEDDVARLESWVRSGVPVFLLAGYIAPDDPGIARMRPRLACVAVPRVVGLFRVALREPRPAPAPGPVPASVPGASLRRRAGSID
jgi:hypothetical protein